MSEQYMIDVDHVTIRFNLASEKIDNLKEYFIKLIKKELMFQEFLAVKDVSLKVKKGEAWALIGVNGSGKSTLLKAISGIMKPYKGTIQVNGSVSPLIELGAGFDANMTARENIYLNGAVLGIPRNSWQSILMKSSNLRDRTILGFSHQELFVWYEGASRIFRGNCGEAGYPDCG